LNLIIIIAALAIVFKMITAGDFYQQSPYFRIIVNTILYIPCSLIYIIDMIFDLLGISKPGSKSGYNIIKDFTTSGLASGKNLVVNSAANIRNTEKTYVVLLGIILASYALYFALPYGENYFAKQGGTLLLNKPVYLTSQHDLADYQSLNDSPEFEYTYAISFWAFLDATAASSNSGSNKYISILSYGGKPNVLYNVEENTLMVTMLKPEGKTIPNMDIDDDGNYIIYKRANILLQKWNNIIVNYNRGTLDVFYNGELVKSVMNVVPYMEYDNLSIGTENGLNGGICNITYFNKSLGVNQIYYLYNMAKDKTPPVTHTDGDETIIQIKKYTEPVTTTANSLVKLSS